VGTPSIPQGSVATYQEYRTAARVGAAGLESLPAIIRAQGERAGPRFIEFFTASILNRNTRMVYARGQTLFRLVR
jgi:hypothetical protein